MSRTPDPVALALARRIRAAGFANVFPDPGGSVCVIAYLDDLDAAEFARRLEVRAVRGEDDVIGFAATALAAEVMDAIVAGVPRLEDKIRELAADWIESAALTEPDPELIENLAALIAGRPGDKTRRALNSLLGLEPGMPSHTAEARLRAALTGQVRGGPHFTGEIPRHPTRNTDGWLE